MAHKATKRWKREFFLWDKLSLLIKSMNHIDTVSVIRTRLNYYLSSRFDQNR